MAADRGGRQASFSPDGTKVVFEWSCSDIYLRDLEAGTTSLVTVAPAGDRVTYESGASDVVATDTNQTVDVFVASLPD